MAAYFTLADDVNIGSGGKLLSYQGVTKGASLVITIKVEVGPYQGIDHVLSSLAEIHKSHNKTPVPAKRRAAPKGEAS